MTLFFPDLNVWLALSDTGHAHSASAWKWREILPDDHKLIFSRYTQIGLLRLLTNVSVMGDQTLTLRKAWGVYDRWLEDPPWSCIPSRAT
jgi:predicted nucleic acid-binding protein